MEEGWIRYGEVLANVLDRWQDGLGWDKGTEGRREGLGGGFFFWMGGDRDDCDDGGRKGKEGEEERRETILGFCLGFCL